MEKVKVNINGNDVTIMEQPSKVILDWERQYKDNYVGYAQQIIKYPSGVNKPLDEILDLPNEIVCDDITLDISNNKLETCQMLLMAVKENTMVFVGETFLKLAKKDINNYKYKQIENIGLMAFAQIKNIAYIGTILNTFRSF